MRRCIGCGRTGPQASFVRLAEAAGRVAPDPDRRAPGRGAYVCRSRSCWERACEPRVLARAFRRPAKIPDDVDFTP